MKSFKKYFIVPATPGEVYLALTNPLTIQLWTGTPAIMSTEPGSSFSLWDDSITGTNVSFEKDKRIVQHWDFGDQAEPSVVTIKLHEHPKGTSVELNHTNIPDEAWSEITEGWEDTYFASLIEFYTP
ncbi:MAG: SRPBCC domain-containing protein [Cyclobacteriaceae bacterium]